MVECNLAKVEVGGSNPLSRSIFPFDPLFDGLLRSRNREAHHLDNLHIVRGNDPKKH